MSVATKNPFAILDADDDSRPSTPAPAPTQEQAPPAPSTRGGAQRGRGGPASRGGRYYQRGGAVNKSAPKEAQNGTPLEDSAATLNAEGGRRKSDGDARGRGRGRGRGGPRGGGRGRPFDRQSQTGKTDSDKRVHQSWGGDDGVAEQRVEEAAVVDANVEVSADWAGSANDEGNWGAPAEDDAPAPAVEGDKSGEREGRRPRDREPEEEDNTLTLDQYLAQQKKDDSIVPKLETRKPEGADEWNDVVPLKKGEGEDAYFVGKAKAAPKARAKKEEKVYLEIDARFERPSRGGRGGRGGDRGDRGERGYRGRGGRGRGVANGSVTAAVNVNDETAFPSLS